MCKWDDANFLIGGGTRPGSDKDEHLGIVDGHAYTVLECHALQANDGTDIDLVKVRNPWGQGEFTSGKWTDAGSGWERYPEIKAACKPMFADDGEFWLSKEEFFEYFPTIFLCALDMRKFVGDWCKVAAQSGGQDVDNLCEAAPAAADSRRPSQAAAPLPPQPIASGIACTEPIAFRGKQSPLQRRVP